MGEHSQELLYLVQLLALVWLTFWAIRAIQDLSLGPATSCSAAIIVHFIFSGLPLGLDLIGPMHTQWAVYADTGGDLLTNLIYCCYIAFCPLFWWYTARVRRRSAGPAAAQVQARFRTYVWRLRLVLYALLLLPLVVLFFAPLPGAYLTYAAIVRGELPGAAEEYHNYITAATTLALLAAAAILFASQRIGATLIRLSPFIFSAVWLNGKRGVVAIWALLMIMVLGITGRLRGKRLVAVSVVAIVLLGFYSFRYQWRYREDVVMGDRMYQNFRFDFGRDQGIKMAIYAELYPERLQILEYRMQSVFFDVVFYIPRSIWPDKPWPYSVYSTAAALNIRPRSIGWGVTTSWLEEAIANFSWFGLLLGPLAIALICRLGDSTGEPVASFISKLVVGLTLTVQLGAWFILAFVWVLVVIRAFRLRDRELRSWRRTAVTGQFAAME